MGPEEYEEEEEEEEAGGIMKSDVRIGGGCGRDGGVGGERSIGGALTGVTVSDVSIGSIELIDFN